MSRKTQVTETPPPPKPKFTVKHAEYINVTFPGQGQYLGLNGFADVNVRLSPLEAVELANLLNTEAAK